MQFNKCIDSPYDPLIYQMGSTNPLFALGNNRKPLSDIGNYKWQQNFLKNITDIRLCLLHKEMALCIQFSKYF